MNTKSKSNKSSKVWVAKVSLSLMVGNDRGQPIPTPKGVNIFFHPTSYCWYITSARRIRLETYLLNGLLLPPSDVLELPIKEVLVEIASDAFALAGIFEKVDKVDPKQIRQIKIPIEQEL